MRPGVRPPLEANGVKGGGVWLDADGGDYPSLHSIERKPEDGPTGAFNHFAFRGTGLLAFLDHLRAHAGFKALLFLAAGVAGEHAGSYAPDRLQLGRALPVMTALAAIGTLASAGVPPLGGAWPQQAVIAAVGRAAGRE